MKLMNRVVLAAIGAAMLVAGVAAQKIQINGAGATFPNPIYSKWFAEYNKLHPNVQINYQSLGSGAGIRQLTNQTVFFGATDGPMTNDQLTGGARQGSARPDGAGRRRARLQHSQRKASSSSPAPCSRTSTSARSRSGTTRRLRS